MVFRQLESKWKRVFCRIRSTTFMRCTLCLNGRVIYPDSPDFGFPFLMYGYSLWTLRNFLDSRSDARGGGSGIEYR